MSTPLPIYLWEQVVNLIKREGWVFEKAYRIEITPEETVVWHDAYDDVGNPIMDKDRKLPLVTRTRIS